MSDTELCYLDLVEVGRRVRAKQLSSVEVTSAMLERIARLDGSLKSFAALTAELAMRQAEQADDEIRRGVHRGPLHGVPIAVKDLCDTRGIPTAAGMAIRKGFLPRQDATVVKRLREAGAVLLGKLQLTEGAYGQHHPSIEPPVNPWSAAHWTGVSSSGSGVATAAGLCFGSLGTDTLGSIRFPSTMNGLTGLKPTWGRVSRAGVFPLAPSMDHVGPMARSAGDDAALLGAIAGADVDDPTASRERVPDYLGGIDEGVRGLRIGIDRSLIGGGVDAAMAQAAEHAASVLGGAGAVVQDITLPAPDEVARDAVLQCGMEAALVHAETFPSRAAEYGPLLTWLLETGRALDHAALARFVVNRQAFRVQLDALFSDIDLLIMPASNAAAPTLLDMSPARRTPEAVQARIRVTAPFDMSGHPALTLPGGKTDAGLPVGFQVIGRHMEEGLVLRAGHAFQKATNWHRRHPTLD